MTDHAAEARRVLQGSATGHSVYESPYEADMVALSEAQVHATLALADEQRTANLIALFDMGGPDATIQGIDYAEVRDTILARLGLTPTTPNQEQ